MSPGIPFEMYPNGKRAHGRLGLPRMCAHHDCREHGHSISCYATSHSRSIMRAFTARIGTNAYGVWRGTVSETSGCQPISSLQRLRFLPHGFEYGGEEYQEETVWIHRGFPGRCQVGPTQLYYFQ